MKPVIVKITRDPNSTIVLLKTCSCNVGYLKQNLSVIFTLLNLALEYKGILILTQKQSFPEITNDEKVAVQVQVKFDTNRHIDEFIQFINEIII